MSPMQELEANAQQLKQEVTAALARLHFDELIAQKSKLDAQASAPGFWDNAQKAQEIMKQQAKLERRVAPWGELKKNTDDLLELIGMDDDSMRQDLAAQLAQTANQFTLLKDELKLAGP